MAEPTPQKALDKARKLINQGDLKLALSALKPLIEIKNPEALFLYSQFSISSLENEHEFEKRSIALLKESSELGYAPAMYALAVCHEMGELIEENKEAAAKLFKKSAEAGYPKAKISHGLNLYYGSNGIKMNKEQALNFLEDAQKDGIEGVNELLSELRNN